jgi:ParB-like chromosome segregation protein Spo0J
MENELNKFNKININELKLDALIKTNINKDKINNLVDLFKKYDICMNIITNKNKIIHGYEILEAAKKCGVKKIEAFVADLSDVEEAEFVLELTKITNQIDKIYVSDMINLLISEGVSRKDICQQLNKGKAWLSKTESISKNLSDNIKKIVKEGNLKSNIAINLARLSSKPLQDQLANIAINDCLNNEEVRYIVDLCIPQVDNDEELKNIINNTALILSNRGIKIKKKSHISNKEDKFIYKIRNIDIEVRNLLNIVHQIKLKDPILIRDNLQNVINNATQIYEIIFNKVI